MKLLASILKSAALVAGAYVSFAYLWAIFRFTVNPYLVAEIIERGHRQSPVHLHAVDTLSFMINWPVVLWWLIAAFIGFFWLGWKKPERSRLRQLSIGLFLAPFIAVTLLFVAGSLAQEREPRASETTRGK